MRAGAWSTNRDLGAARLSWERARRIADALPADDPDQLSMRIAPRTMLCATDLQARAVQESRGRFAELRELCSAAGDKVSLAIGMTGLATELLYAGRSREGSRLASEQMALLESIGDPTLTMGLAFIAFANWFDAGEFGEILRWSQTVVDLAAGDPAKGAGFGVGSPLAVALACRGVCSVVAGPSRMAPRPPRRRREERGADRRTSPSRRRAPGRLWLAHARRRVVNQPRSRRCPAQLGAGMPNRRHPTRRPPRPTSDAHRPPHHAVCHRLSRPSSPGKPGPLRGAAGVVQRGRDKVSLPSP